MSIGIHTDDDGFRDTLSDGSWYSGYEKKKGTDSFSTYYDVLWDAYCERAFEDDINFPRWLAMKLYDNDIPVKP